MGERNFWPNPVDVLVGNKVMDKRADLRLSQEYMADKLGLRLNEYRDSEFGTRRFGAPCLLKIARLLDVSAAYFFETLTEVRRKDIN
jgi:transcriptional regulator with XRE-family HTH domain